MKKITRLLGVLFLTLIFSQFSYGQTTLNFTGGFASIAQSSFPVTTSSESGTITLTDGNVWAAGSVGSTNGFISVQRNASSQLSFTHGGTHTYHFFKRNDGTNFKVDNINIQFNISNTTSATLMGYDDGAFVTDATHTFTFAQGVAQSIADTALNDAFDNVDEIRISFGATPNLSATTQVNSFTYSTAAPSDTTNPTFDSANSTPNDNATGVSVSNDIVIDFDEDIAQGTGNINLYRNSRRNADF